MRASQRILSEEGILICIATGRFDPAHRYPLVVAANRDEFYERQGEAAAFREGDPLDFVAPLDPTAGGTWFGLNEAGLVILITNQPVEKPREDSLSRGLLVRELLEHATDLDDASARVRALQPQQFNPFSLVVLGPQGILSVSHTEDRGDHWRRYGRGSFFVSNRRDFRYSRQGYSWQHLASFNGSTGNGVEPQTLRENLQLFCRSHDSFEYREAICQHGEIHGTLSSSIVVVDQSRRSVSFDFAQGAPCESTYEAVTLPSSFEASFLSAWKNQEAEKEPNTSLP